MAEKGTQSRCITDRARDRAKEKFPLLVAAAPGLSSVNAVGLITPPIMFATALSEFGSKAKKFGIRYVMQLFFK